MSKNTAAAAAVAEALIHHLTASMDEPDIGANQLRMLLALRIHGDIPQANLEKFAGVKKSAVSRNVAKLGVGEKPLEKPGPGLVESVTDLGNRRQHIVRLTPRGRAVVDAAADKAAAFIPRSM